MMLIPTIINQKARHLGGVGIINFENAAAGINKGDLRGFFKGPNRIIKVI
ncbi:MAG: hypothetical protein IPH28_10480 [Cytophagaceae bacterium]|nr:hypothetical protein [Cytophagaceae bacterium]MBK9933371.1 hypothetical protein [Cytophagaceae bacterium]MBL0302913.1 hypothetical protein [Cytophagaceae bacterium]MBL0325743.1 hypothetical protein [Cytophagaceae bacterium]